MRAYIMWTLTFVLVLIVLAPVLFFTVILLAGPHSDILPSMLQPVVLIAGLVALIAVPFWCARRVYRRVASRRPNHTDATGGNRENRAGD